VNEPADTYVYVDTATGGAFNRNHMMRLVEYHLPDNAVDCFTTFLLFTEDLLTYAAAHPHPKTGEPSVAGYPGPAYAPILPFDFDCKSDPGRAIAAAAQAVRQWEAHYDLPTGALRIFWSGSKGISIEVPGALFGGFEPGPDIAERLGCLAEAMLDGVETADLGIYNKLRLWRVPNTRHSGSGLYKIPLTVEELMVGDLARIRGLARAPRDLGQSSADGIGPRPKLVDLWETIVAAPISHKRVDPIPEEIPEHERNNTLTSLAGSMRHRGMTEEEIAAALLAVNPRCRPPLPEYEVRGIAASVCRYAPGDAGATDDGQPRGWLVTDAPWDPDHHGLYRRGADGPLHVLREALTAEEIIQAEGVVLGAYVRVVPLGGSARQVFLPAEAITSRDFAVVLHEAAGIAWLSDDARIVQRWLALVLNRAPHIRRADALLRPRWVNGRPLLPGSDVRLVPGRGADVLAAYGECAGGESAARIAWAELVRAAVEHPRLAMVMGAAVVSIYLGQLGRAPFIVHLPGESRRGKTLAVRTAMAAFGDPDKLIRTWNTTRNAALERLAVAGILPVAFDEMGAAGVRDETLEATVFGAASGVGRGRARRDGGLREGAGWCLVVLSTGERRLVTTSGLTGIRARVVEVQAPVTPDAETIDRLHDLATSHYGWPLAWLRGGDPALETVRADIETIEAELLARATTPVLRTLAKHLAACAAGFRALARWCGDEVSVEGVTEAAARVLAECESVFEDEGPSVADRLLDAVFEAEARHPGLYPRREGDGHAPDGTASFEGMVGGGFNHDGVDLGDRLAVYPSVVRQLAREIGLVDPTAALRELRARGDLVVDGDGRHLARVMRVGSHPVRVYVFRRPAAGEDVADAGQVVTSGAEW
jgi:hypothetical protein